MPLHHRPRPWRLLLATLSLTCLLAACGSGSSGGSEGPSSPRADDPRPNIIFVLTDDQGHADIGVQGVRSDLKTPFIDQLAAEGVRMTRAYVTGPQCTPSRGALMTGRYQQHFGLDDNRYTPMPLGQVTLAERLRDAGYATGMVGKWHLEVDDNSAAWWHARHPELAGTPFTAAQVPFDEQRAYFADRRGFQDVFMGTMNTFWANFSLDGHDRQAGYVSDRRFRVDVVSDAAEAYIHRHADQPFFLYVAYFAPHVPLEAPETYLSRFPGDMPVRRRTALAMLAAVDDGVGRIMAALKQHGIERNTLLVFLSDNGAPLDIAKVDAPLSDKQAPWNGSLNEPWVGEKGMLSEGGLRVPMIARWPARVAAGQRLDEPVISIDLGATALAGAGLDTQAVDGHSLIPVWSGLGDPSLAERPLYWRFWDQAAIRQGRWKYLSLGGAGEYLFDLESGAHEGVNLIRQQPEVAGRLKSALGTWQAGLTLPGTPSGPPSGAEKKWYEFYFNGL